MTLLRGRSGLVHPTNEEEIRAQEGREGGRPVGRSVESGMRGILLVFPSPAVEIVPRYVLSLV